MVKSFTTFHSLPIPKNADVIALYALIAIALLSPMASNSVLPQAPDHANHTALIVQAKQALDEGQLPLKVAPYQHDNLRYPVFQFYSQTPYLIGGLLYKYVFPTNPWLAIKLVYFAGLWFAAFLTFKTGSILGFDRPTSISMGVVYVTAPYILINIHARGAYTEAFAQFIIPLLAFTSLRLVRNPTTLGFLWTSIAWLVLGTSHLITFVYTTAFYLFLVAILYLWRAISLRNIFSLIMAVGLGWLISAFQWYPAATIMPLQVHSRLQGLFASRWLTPLSTLLSLMSTPPEPLGRDTTPFLHASVGVPILIAIAGLLYFGRRLGPTSNEINPLLLLFATAFICTWSPIDFWAYLPRGLTIAQFSYRFLTYTVVSGTVLFGYFLYHYKLLIGPLPALLVITILFLFARPYLPTLEHNTRTLRSIIAQPDIGYGAGDYLYSGHAAISLESDASRYEMRLPLVSVDNWLQVSKALPVTKAYIEMAHPQLILEGTADGHNASCNQLQLTLDNTVIATNNILPGDFEWRVPARAFRAFQGEAAQLAFVSSCGFIPHSIDPSSTDNRQLWIRVKTLRFQRTDEPPAFAPTEAKTMPLLELRPHCRMAGTSVTCALTVPQKTLAQLPLLFYPSVLEIRINGRDSSYTPSSYGQLTLAQVELASGTNNVVARFAGSKVGNVLSVLGCLIVVGTVFGRRLSDRMLQSTGGRG